MKLFGKDLDHEIAVVAEIGVNHEGNAEAASKMLRLAAEAGADAVKFQSYTPSRYASASDPQRLERVSQFALDLDTHRRLAREADALDVAFFSTPLTEDWVPLLDPMVPVFKVASGDLNFEPAIRAAAQTGKPLLVSTGLGTIEEIDHAVALVRDEVGEADLADRLALLHCVSAYPTPLEEANVLAIPYLSERYGLTVGYSNHVTGPHACYAAVAVGAPLIEVHFTDRKSGRSFRDHELSFEPQELRDLVQTLPMIGASLGRPEKVRMQCEAGNLQAIRKGVVAARDIAAGTVLQEEDLMYARPASEVCAGRLHELIGKRLETDRQLGELIACADVGLKN